MNTWKFTFLLAPLLASTQIHAQDFDDEYDDYAQESTLSLRDDENLDEDSLVVDNDQGQSATPMTTPSQEFTSQPTSSMTPAVAPAVKNGVNVFVTADFIYWKAQQEGLDFAASGVYNDPFGGSPYTNVGKGEDKQPDFTFQPGFKVGVGLDFAHDGWDLYANYTWLNPASHTETINQPSDSYLWNGQWGHTFVPALTDSLASASASWKLNFNVIDLELGRNFFISKFLTLRPFIGLKGAWLKQDYDITNAPRVASTAAYLSANYNMKEEFQGIGIRGGVSPVWHFLQNWGVYGDLACSIMWNHVSSDRRDVLNQTSGPLTVLNYEKNFHTVLPVLEMGIGLSYMGWFSNETYMLEVKAGWEEQVWFSMNQFLNPTATPSGNMTTQGFTLKVGFTF